jgi:ABC-2 type transport system permease protein
MPSKTSWINKEIIVQSLRNVGWVGIVYFIGLLFSLPVDIMGQLSNDTQIHPIAIYENLFKMQYPIQMGLMLFIPVLLSLFLFRYLHVKQAGDFMHSLPITRRKLFLHFTGTGFGIIIIPILLNTVILLSLYSFTDLQQYIGVQDIFVWCGITMLMSVLLFTASTFVAMITGLTAVQGALTYILLLLPAGMFMLVCYSLKNLLFGFPEDYFFDVQIEKYSPLIKTVYLENKLLSATDVLIFILITLVFYGFSYVLYKMRKVESASQAIVYPFLRPLFKYGISFCFMLIGGMYFNGIYQSQGWTIFGYFFGSLIGYYLGEMVLQKHWRVFRQWKGYAGFAIVIVLLGFIIQFDLFQYEENVPELADVEKVHVSQSYYSLTDNPDNLIKDPFMTDRKTIEAVLNLHGAIVNHQTHTNKADEKNEQIFLYYKMKDGSKIVRNYVINIEEFKSQYTSLYEMKNYKEKTEQIYGVDSGKVDKLTLYTERGNKPGITISAPGEINEAINILKKETYDESFEDRDKVQLYHVQLLLSNDKWAHAGVKNSDKKFITWLREKGYLKELKMTASDIEWMYVTDQDDYRNPLSQPVEQTVLDLKKENKGIEVKDAVQIESIMDQLVYDHMNSPYTVIIKYKNDESIQTLGLQKEDAPSFINTELND